MDGNEIWVSPALEGIGQGSVVISDDGNYVMLTHNGNFQSVGYFTVLSAADGSVFSQDSDNTAPFSAPGIFHNPAVGYYDGTNGVGNTNDMIMFLTKPRLDEDPIENTGIVYAFQFPVDFDGTASDNVGIIRLGDNPRTHKASAAPVLTNMGRSAFFGATRSRFIGWAGTEGLARFHFNRGFTNSAEFGRNSGFRGQPVFATPALSSDPMAPTLFGGTASEQFIRLSYDFTAQVVMDTTATITSSAKVDPEDRAVYYVESNGIIHSADFADITDNWKVETGVPSGGEIALSDNGSMLFVGDAQGLITAYQVSAIAETAEPSSAPSVTGGDTPAPTPAGGSMTPAPVVVTDTPAPTEAPVDQTASPTESAASSAATFLAAALGVVGYFFL